jgi:hypothetical protein
VYTRFVGDFTDHFSIIGAGPIGIFLADKLLDKGKKVLLVEAGNFSAESKLLGYSNYLFETPSMLPKNVHRIGGGGNYWIGRVGEFNDLDFQEIPNVRNERWPFPKSQLNDYYQSCYKMLMESPIMDDLFIESFSGSTITLPNEFRIRPIRYIDPDIFNKLLRKNIHNPNLTILSDHLCLEITEDASPAIPSIKLQTSLGGFVTIKTKVVILAAGTLQSTKLVLSSPTLVEDLPQNVAGKYLMEHLEGYVGTLSINRRNFKTLLGLHLNNERKLMRHGAVDFGVSLGISETLTKELSLVNVSIEIVALRINYLFDPAVHQDKSIILNKIIPILFLLERFVRWTTSRIVKLVNLVFLHKTSYSLWMKAEELPFLDSELRTSEYEENKLVYNHKVSSKTSKEVRKVLELIQTFIERNNLGSVEYYPEITNSQNLITLRPNWHPMGTLRIGDIRSGVVNENLKINGTDNVYVLSPAVFPTGSNQNPVFTTLALALRLADQFH